jgi:hypothetical protein
MPNIACFTGPVEVKFDPAKPLPLVLTGHEHSALATRLILSFDVAANPQLPEILSDVVVAAAGDARGGQFLLQTVAREYRFEAQRVFVHRDLRALMHEVVPPQPVSLAYRLRWRLGMLVARVPLLRGWLLARAAMN